MNTEFFARKINSSKCKRVNCKPCNKEKKSVNRQIMTKDTQFLESLEVASILIGIQYNNIACTWNYLLTLRNNNLRRSPGSVCFPGGMVEETDRSVIDAALREANEEIGLTEEDANVIGVLPPLLSKLGVLIHPVVAILKPSFMPLPNPNEVEDIFYVDVSKVCHDMSHRSFWSVHCGVEFPLDYFDYQYKGHMYTAWGITAVFLSILSYIFEIPTDCTKCEAMRSIIDVCGGPDEFFHIMLENYDIEGDIGSLKWIPASTLLEQTAVQETKKKSSPCSKL